MSSLGNLKTDGEPSGTDECSSSAPFGVAESPLSPAIFKLNVDCLHEVFEWLDLCEIISVAGTCKRLYHAAGAFFRWNYVSKEITMLHGSIYTPFCEINIFIEYIPRISITCNNMKLNRLIGEKCKSFRHIRSLGSLIEDQIEHFKGILKHVPA